MSQPNRVLIWMLVALFFAVALYPPVDWVQRRVLRRRSLATLLVFLVVLITIGATLSAFAVPLAQEGTQLAGQLPVLINEARAGRGPVGRLLERCRIDEISAPDGTAAVDAEKSPKIMTSTTLIGELESRMEALDPAGAKTAWESFSAEMIIQ